MKLNSLYSKMGTQLLKTEQYWKIRKHKPSKQQATGYTGKLYFVLRLIQKWWKKDRLHCSLFHWAHYVYSRNSRNLLNTRPEPKLPKRLINLIQIFTTTVRESLFFVFIFSSNYSVGKLNWNIIMQTSLKVQKWPLS